MYLLTPGYCELHKMAVLLISLLGLSVLCSGAAAQKFGFAGYYGSSMVLQHAPARAGVWGYADPSSLGQQVVISLTPQRSGHSFTTEVPVEFTGEDVAVWRVVLPARPAGPTLYSITASLGAESIVLGDIVFGEVWICSGQSNMEMETFKTLNGTEELAGAHMYEYIRVLKVPRMGAKQPNIDFPYLDIPWSRATQYTVRPFSSLCYSYGRKLQELHNKPVGLIDSTLAGSMIEAWSSMEALLQCYNPESIKNVSSDDNKAPTRLWNGMIHPLLRMTITGVIWYQGETNADHMDKTADYSCTFPIMLRDWRYKFLQGTNGQTEDAFPFGFVQIATTGDSYDMIDGFPSLRWKQTAGQGRVPNKQLEHTFMAVSMDLPDFHSPEGSLHPRDKTTISSRLVLGFRKVVGREDIDNFSAVPTAYRLDRGTKRLDIVIDDRTTPFEMLNKHGFEICCSEEADKVCEDKDTRWQPAPIISSSVKVSLDISACKAAHIIAHRYAWRTNPCPYKQCALYTARHQLPFPTYMKNQVLLDDGNYHRITLQD